MSQVVLRFDVISVTNNAYYHGYWTFYNLEQPVSSVGDNSLIFCLKNVRRSKVTKVISLVSLAVLLSTGFLSEGFAAEIRELVVEHDKGLYRLQVRAYVDAPTNAIYDILTDYHQFERVADGITAARVVENPRPDLFVLWTRLRSCIAFICLEKEKIERIELLDGKQVTATVLPEHSDFKYGLTRWNLTPQSNGTVINLDMELEPDFWIPPLIGPPIVKSLMRKEGKNSANIVETLAKQPQG